MKFIIAFILTLFFFYLVGSFIALSFNIADWDAIGRGTVSLTGTCIAAAVGSIVYYD